MSKFNFAAYIEAIKSKKDDEVNRRRANTRKLRQFILIVCEGAGFSFRIQ